ncbi:uncharacterized protein MONOS_10536 [Monocercomonoides exilis]|uniref:uncharacterized protein n=1 Tax=Monocercomonoides exilis TaxID=2049356 RepID=UPI00355AB2ED|nr:hypothetical protein MONOS_10536 [Monocercomonoides exilis]|eukprot:MONOS_10536.1-p1 / transcript=MONOS_10536.1 / gene=MONOS_10536 / organism=Monocercomonoides_exilis_PA203 / gene_product=unspecified product / transcript_product=unspecified product / location=Mono_scaffold00483:745-2573(+) / protein_length=419 / sequence_SO=supercontig / SO=protein_coding / is_pseudo=false
MQSTTISHNTALSFSSLPFKISSGLLPKSPDESSPPPSWYQSRKKDTKQNKSTELHILQEIREELANIIDFSHKRSTQYHEQNLLSSISKNDETLIEELKNKIDGSNEKKSLFGTFQPSSERGELDSLTSSSSSSSSSSISSRFCESVTTEDTNSSSDAVSSELSEPQRIIETISSWKPGTVKCVQLSNDVEVEVDGKRQSNCTETRRLLMENEWKREDAMLVNMNMSLPSVAASQKEGSEASEVSTSNREHENDCEGRTEHSQAGAEANNPTAFRQKVRKMHRELARHQVKDAKSYFKIFGLWVRKAWLTDEDEKRVWDEAERKLKIGVSEQGIVVNERKKDTLEELKGELEKAEAEAEAGGGRGEGEGEGEGEGGRGGEKKIGKEEIEELKMKILRKEKKIEKSRQFEGYCFFLAN